MLSCFFRRLVLDGFFFLITFFSWTLLKCARKICSNVFRCPQYWCDLNFMLTTEVFQLILTSSCTQSLLRKDRKQKIENRNGVKYQILNVKYQIQSLKSVEYFKAGIIAQVVRRGVQTWSKIQIDPIFERFKYSKGSHIPIFQRSNNIPKL